MERVKFQETERYEVRKILSIEPSASTVAAAGVTKNTSKEALCRRMADKGDDNTKLSTPQAPNTLIYSRSKMTMRRKEARREEK
jgi:hypothetical protein